MPPSVQFFSFLVWTIIWQNIFATGLTGSRNKLCNLGLTRTQTTFTHKAVKYIMYMSLCKPLRDLPREYFPGGENFDNYLLIILKKSQPSFNLWASASGDFVYDENGAQLELFSPNGLKYSAVISFKCSQEENEPIFEDFRQESNSFVFKWQAPFACLLSHQNIMGNCSLKFGKKVFNMTSLTHPSHYTMQEKDYKVYINFCAPVNLKDCQSSGAVITGCIMHNNKTYSMEKYVFNATFVEEKAKIELKYSLAEGVKGVIDFQCKDDMSTIKPAMRVSKKPRKVSIIMETSVVCMSDDRCDINYDEERYSLPRAPNILIKEKTAIFLLSACGPLKSDSFWLGGETSASLINETVMSLGSKRSLSRIKEGELMLTLTKGSFCPGTKHRAKTVIKFICSDEDTGPVFLHKSENCVFSFQWKGPTYCPVLEATGKGCDVRDPFFGITYRLGDDDGDGGDGINSQNGFEISHEDYIFRLNLCGKVKKSCQSDMDASVCLLTNNKETVLGRESSLTYSFKQGSVVLELWGSECAANVKYHVIVNVVCEFGASDRFVPVLNESDSDCVFNFVWYTKKRCPMGEQLPCIVKNQNGSVADLSPLRLKSSNYRVAKDKDSYFLLNVCGPLWYGSHETCRPSSAACLVNKGKYFISIGEAQNNPTVTDKNEVVLVYKYDSFLPFRETVIIFVCDEKNEGPQYIGSEGEKHSFKWKTKFACFNKTDGERVKLEQVKEEEPEKTLTVPNNSKGIFDPEVQKTSSSPIPEIREKRKEYFSKPEKVSCITSDSQNFIDLSVLEPVYVTFSKCVRLYVDVCKKVYCTSSNSSETFRLGSRVNPPALDDSGFVTVNYYDDVLCGGHSNRSLSFIFVCDKSRGKGMPTLKNQSSCSYTFLWNTSVVCPKDVLLLIKSEGNLINKSSNEVLTLEPFLRKPFLIERQSESLYVNPLSSNVLDGGAPCNGDFCEKKNESWISHGILKNLISYDYNYNRIVMEFDGGDLCIGTRRYSSKIYLNCSENGISHPKSDDWAISRDYCEIILEVVTPCFHQIKPVSAANATVIFLAVCGALLVLLAMSFGFYFTVRRKKRCSSFSGMMLIRNEGPKYSEKEL